MFNAWPWQLPSSLGCNQPCCKSSGQEDGRLGLSHLGTLHASHAMLQQNSELQEAAKAGTRVIISVDPAEDWWQGRGWLFHDTVPQTLHPFDCSLSGLLEIAVTWPAPASLLSWGEYNKWSSRMKQLWMHQHRHRFFVSLPISKAQSSLYRVPLRRGKV